MTKKPLWITFAFNLNLSRNQAEPWSEGVLSCQHQHALVSATTTYRSRQRKIKETSEIYQPAISDYQPPPVPLLPASIHPSSLLFISVSMWHQLYPLLPLSLSSLKAESLLLRSDLSPSLPLFLSPPLCSFSCPVHIMNDWKMCTVLSALVYLCERTQFQRRRLTLKENGNGETGGWWVDGDRSTSH